MRDVNNARGVIQVMGDKITKDDNCYKQDRQDQKRDCLILLLPAVNSSLARYLLFSASLHSLIPPPCVSYYDEYALLPFSEGKRKYS